MKVYRIALIAVLLLASSAAAWAQKPITKPLIIDGHEYVDLGLSVKWATCNIGASSPSDFGNYYAWGETETKSSYTMDNSVTLDKEIGDISGNPQYDAARANWKGTWRLPTKAECTELKNKCKWEWTVQGDHPGYKVTGSNGNSIFLPAEGFYQGSKFYLKDYMGRNCGEYWSSSPHSLDSNCCTISFFDSYYGINDSQSRWIGNSIRPVCD